MIDIGGSIDLKVENKSLNIKNPSMTKTNLVLDEWKWKRREEIDTELGYFYDVAWEPDPFTSKRKSSVSKIQCFLNVYLIFAAL